MSMLKCQNLLIAIAVSALVFLPRLGLADDEAQASVELGQPIRGYDEFVVLSEADRDLYSAIFEAQQRGSWTLADQHIAALQNKQLLGYVLHQRYMHPTAYISTYAELTNWLHAYKDHPNASSIYKLARRKRPKGASSPPGIHKRRWRFEGAKSLSPKIATDYEANRNPRLVRKIEQRVRYLCAEDRPTQALNFLKSRPQRQWLTERQFDRMSSWIAAAYYYNDKIPAARSLAGGIARRNPESAPLSLWIAGLIAWRDSAFEESFNHFSKMAVIDFIADDLRAAANFWAARAALRQKPSDTEHNPGAIIGYLTTASAYPLTFYGQLAHAQLGTEPDYAWEESRLSAGEWAVLRQKNSRLDRAAALAQLGQYHNAHTELRWAHGEMDQADDGALLKAAFTFDLWAAQLDIALAATSASGSVLPEGQIRAGLYPVPDFKPDTGFQIDRAVLFGLIRQESKFKPLAESRSGAKGLMQLMPRTASYVSGDRRLQFKSQASRLHDVGYNMQLGQSYVRYLLQNRNIGQDLVEMSIAYNWGPGNLRRWKKRIPIKDPLLMIESIPDSEARHFVDFVMTNIWVYRARLGQSAPSRESMAARNKAIYKPVDGVAY